MTTIEGQQMLAAAGVTLTELAARYGSDKGSKHPRPHHYTRTYDMLLQPRRNTLVRMLEIGLFAGGPEVGGKVDRKGLDLPSAKMWLSYFPSAIVQGFDISDFSFFKHPRFEFTRGDAGVEADLLAAVEGRGTYDLIIDDGSHASFHQQLAFQCLFPSLRRGGLYIIEDLHWQSPYYEGILPQTFTTADMIRNWFRTKTFPESPAPQLSGLSRLADEIDLAFIMNQPFAEHDLPKLAVIQKCW